MIRLLVHDHSIPRENDAAVRFDKGKFDGASPWSISDWISFLTRGGGPKKKFRYCLNPISSEHFLYFRRIQGHSGCNLVDPALQDNVLLPEDFTDYGGYKPFLERWHKDYKYRSSLSLIGWTEEQIIEHDRIALEDHSYVATKPERFKIQNIGYSG